MSDLRFADFIRMAWDCVSEDEARTAVERLVRGADWPPRVSNANALLSWACFTCVGQGMDLARIHGDLAAFAADVAQAELQRRASVMGSTLSLSAVGARVDDGIDVERLARMVFNLSGARAPNQASAACTLVNLQRFVEGSQEADAAVRADVLHAAELVYGAAFRHRPESEVSANPTLDKISSDALLQLRRTVSSRAFPDSQLPDSKLPDSKLPDSQIPDSQIPDSQIPDSQRSDAPASATASSPASAIAHAFPHLTVMSAGDAPAMWIVQTEEIDRSCPSELAMSSFRSVMELDHEDAAMMQALDVAFAGETGFGNGVVRDWITALFEALADPAWGLFCRVPGSPHVLHPNPDGESPSYDRVRRGISFGAWMEFVGRVLGLALRLSAPTGVHLSTPLIAMMRGEGRSLWMEDLLAVEPMVHASCLRLLEARGQVEIDAMRLPGFTAREHDLLPAGSDVRVTKENRTLLAQLLVDFYCNFNDVTGRAAAAIRAGLAFVALTDDAGIRKTLSSLSAHGVNEATGGRVSVSAADLREATTTVSVVPDVEEADASRTVHLFWNMVGGMGASDRRRLLRFWTGSCGLHGVDLGIVVQGERRMPSSRTCYNQLYVSVVDDAKQLSEMFECALASADGGINEF
jgi:hypothetical protein